MSTVQLSQEVVSSAQATLVSPTPVGTYVSPTPERGPSPTRTPVRHDELPFERKMVVMTFVALTQLVQVS